MKKKKIESFTDLICWQEGHKLVLIIYQTTKEFPKDELYGLVAQMRRAAVSITSNIAEGFGRYSYKEKAQFYGIARGSAIELQNQLLVARDVDYLNADIFMKIARQLIGVHKLLNALTKATRQRI